MSIQFIIDNENITDSNTIQALRGIEQRVSFLSPKVLTDFQSPSSNSNLLPPVSGGGNGDDPFNKQPFQEL